jgi:hypothetical protein
MSAQHHKRKMTGPNRSSSMIESLEGRQLFAATLAPDGFAAAAGKVSTNDISFTAKLTKHTPGLVDTSALKIKLTDVLVSSY